MRQILQITDLIKQTKIQKYMKKNCFVLLKDHKETSYYSLNQSRKKWNRSNQESWKSINKKNAEIKGTNRLNQRRKFECVISCLKNILEKHLHKFFVYSTKEFYLLLKALNIAGSSANISHGDTYKDHPRISVPLIARKHGWKR